MDKLGGEQSSQKLRFFGFYLLRNPNFNLILTLNKLFDTEFNGGHFKDENVKNRMKARIFRLKKTKSEKPGFCELCSTPYSS